MVEFVLEVRVLAQLIEEDSYDLLTEMAQTVDLIRTNLFDGAVELSDELKEQMERAAHLRRIAALAQSLSHPQYWSRAEFATQKADRLLDLLDVPRIFDHIARNIDSINVATDHVDELYIAYLAEQNNGRATRLSINLALVSFVLAILVLPSFWADWIQVVDEFGWNSQLDWGGFLSGLAIAGMVLAGLFVMAFKRYGKE